MKANLKILAAAIMLTSAIQGSHAGPVGPLTTFNSGTPAIASEVNGNFSVVKTAVDDNASRVGTLETTVASLQAQITALQTLLAGVTRTTLNGQPAIQFSGMNVQIVSGAGTTDAAPNGRGNLIVGYDEAANSSFFCSIGTEANGTPIGHSSSPTPPAACTNAGGTWAQSHKSGSHYLVAGPQHNYSQFGGILVGFRNTSNNAFASVSGGSGNAASGNSASVSGGEFNTASRISSSVSGGSGNAASGNSASVSGGTLNTASGSNAGVSGGNTNIASGVNASVSGGFANTAANTEASVSGGFTNTASGGRASVSGGSNNLASAGGSSVSGGTFNIASGPFASVSGGTGNTASGTGASVSGGTGNTAIGSNSSVSGGQVCSSGATLNKWVVGLSGNIPGCSANAN